MATFVNPKDKTENPPRVKVIVALAQDVSALVKELESAGYKKSDPAKVFGRKDWVVIGSELVGTATRYDMVPADPLTPEQRLEGLLRNARALQVATAYETTQLNETKS